MNLLSPKSLSQFQPNLAQSLHGVRGLRRFFLILKKQIVYFFLLKGKNMALCRCIYGLELYFRCAMLQMGLLLWTLISAKNIILNLPSFTGNGNVSTCMSERSLEGRKTTHRKNQTTYKQKTNNTLI